MKNLAVWHVDECDESCSHYQEVLSRFLALARILRGRVYLRFHHLLDHNVEEACCSILVLPTKHEHA